MKDLKVALVPVARIHFDTELAEQLARSFRTNLIFNGLKVLGTGRLVTNLDQAKQLAQELDNQDFDLLLIFQTTFTDSSLLMALTEVVQKPVFLWGVPEETTGGRLRLASLSGLNLATHALNLNNIPYEFVYAPVNDLAGFQKITACANASRVKARLLNARVGVVGQPPDGMDTCFLDEAVLQEKMGLTVVRIGLAQVLERVRRMDEARTAAIRPMLNQKLANLDSLDQPSLHRSLSTYLVLKEIASAERLDSLAVRCWPEFFEDLQCAACGPLSMLSNEQVPCSCEADVNGAASQLILHWLSDSPAFNTDLVTADIRTDSMVVWHCGQAPLAMADPKVEAQAAVHSNRGVPFMMDFPLKPGKVTFARLSRSKAGPRMIVGAGEMLSAQKSFTGTSGVVRMNRPPAEVLDNMLREGMEHHMALTYGEFLPSLRQLARMLDVPLLEL